MTGTPHDTSPGGLIALVQEQLGLYEQLELLSVRQSALVESEDTDALLEVLNERQKLIEYITDVSARMTPYRARWDDHVNQLAESGQQWRQRVWRRVVATLDEVDGQAQGGDFLAELVVQFS